MDKFYLKEECLKSNIKLEQSKFLFFIFIFSSSIICSFIPFFLFFVFWRRNIKERSKRLTTTTTSVEVEETIFLNGINK